MNYKIEKKPNSKKEIEVVLSLEEIEKYLEEAAHKLSLEIKIRGFRPGKAPLSVVREAVGEERLWKEASYEAINKSYQEIVKKESLDVISTPDIEIINISLNQPLTYKASVSVMPEIMLSDYKTKAKKIVSEKKKVEVSSEEIDRAINSIRSSRAKIVRVSREAKEGDEVVINFSGSVDGIIQEGLRSKKTPLVLGETPFINGFQDFLLGMKEGERKKFTLKIPFVPEQEKEVEFDVEVISVNERELPEANDEFAKSLADFSGIDELKKKIENKILSEKEGKENERIRIKIIEAISEDVSVEIPQVLIERETENMLHEFKEQFSQNEGSFQDYILKSNKTEEEIKKSWEGQAQKRILANLIIHEIAKKEQIKAEEEEVEKQATAYLNLIDNKKNVDRKRLKVYLADVIQNDKVFRMLESL